MTNAAPGLFFFLVKQGAVSGSALAPLLSLLPPERYLRTSVREGEGFDSTRWPLAQDAALARRAAMVHTDPAGRIGAVLRTLEALGADREALKTLSATAHARRMAALGLGLDDFAQIASRLRHAVSEAERQAFAEPPWPAAEAGYVADLVAAHWQAADGLYAFHLARNLPGPSAEPAARVVAATLASGALTVERLLEDAIHLVTGDTPP